MRRVDPTVLDKVVFPLGIGCGVALGYLVLVALPRRDSGHGGKVWVQRPMQVMGALLIGLALWNVVILVGGR
jgi:hypothetical protein